MLMKQKTALKNVFEIYGTRIVILLIEQKEPDISDSLIHWLWDVLDSNQ